MLVEIDLNQPLVNARAAFEQGYLAGVLTRFRGNVTASARHVEMAREALSRKIAEYGLDPNEYRPAGTARIGRAKAARAQLRATAA